MVHSRVLTPNDKIAVSVIGQLTRELAIIKEKVNDIEERLQSIAASVDEIECCM